MIKDMSLKSEIKVIADLVGPSLQVRLWKVVSFFTKMATLNPISIFLSSSKLIVLQGAMVAMEDFPKVVINILLIMDL